MMKIKTNSAIVRGLSIFLLFFLTGSGCFLFDTDLKLRVMFDKLDGLKIGAPVIYAYRHQVIGEVIKIEKLDGGDAIAHVEIASDYQGLVRTGALFVIEKDLFDKTQPSRLLMDVLPKDMNNPPIESGTLVKGISWAYYQMAVSAASVGPAIDAIIRQSRRFLAEIEAFIDSGEIERMVDGLKSETQRITEFSAEQKKNFVENILPDLEKQVNEAIQRLEQSGDRTDRENLQREFDGLKKELNE